MCKNFSFVNLYAVRRLLALMLIYTYFISFTCRVWKEITLNSTSDQVEYRVWDYPIKEQYGHILQAITQVGPVKTTEEGFKKVEKRKEKERRRKEEFFSINFLVFLTLNSES